MRIPRIYTPIDLQENTLVELPAETAHYLGKVLRMQAGRELVLFNGKGGEYHAELTEVSKKSASTKLNSFNTDNRESPLKTHLAIGISRGERWDFVLQKATELGITEITPLFTERCEVKLSGDRLGKKFDHWQGIITSACEQSQRNILPILHQPQKLTDFLQQEQEGLNLVLYHRSDKKLIDYAEPQACTLLVGPEGGLSDVEIEQALDKSFQALTLGPRVLRTETAPLAALSALQLTWGDF